MPLRLSLDHQKRRNNGQVSVKRERQNVRNDQTILGFRVGHCHV